LLQGEQNLTRVVGKIKKPGNISPRSHFASTPLNSAYVAGSVWNVAACVAAWLALGLHSADLSDDLILGGKVRNQLPNLSSAGYWRRREKDCLGSKAALALAISAFRAPGQEAVRSRLPKKSPTHGWPR
jgi:hypothetical protein